MKYIIFLVLNLWVLKVLGNTSLNLSQEKMSLDIKGCLASIYTAQKAFHEEKLYYSENLDEVGFETENCPSISDYNFKTLNKDHFEILVLDKNKKVIGSVNSKKEIVISY